MRQEPPIPTASCQLPVDLTALLHVRFVYHLPLNCTCPPGITHQPAVTCAPAPPSQSCSSSLGAHQNGVAPNQPSSSAPLTSTLGLGQANPINHSMSSYVLHAPYSGIRSRQALVAATRTLGPWHQHEPWQWFSMAFHCCTMRPVAFCLAELASLARRRLLFSACVAVIVSCPVKGDADMSPNGNRFASLDLRSFRATNQTARIPLLSSLGAMDDEQ